MSRSVSVVVWRCCYRCDEFLGKVLKMIPGKVRNFVGLLVSRLPRPLHTLGEALFCRPHYRLHKQPGILGDPGRGDNELLEHHLADSEAGVAQTFLFDPVFDAHAVKSPVSPVGIWEGYSRWASVQNEMFQLAARSR